MSLTLAVWPEPELKSKPKPYPNPIPNQAQLAGFTRALGTTPAQLASMSPDARRRAIFRLNFSAAHMRNLQAKLLRAKQAAAEAKQTHGAPAALVLDAAEAWSRALDASVAARALAARPPSPAPAEVASTPRGNAATERQRRGNGAATELVAEAARSGASDAARAEAARKARSGAAAARPFGLFCAQQRPLLPAALRGAADGGCEKQLGQMWQALSEAEKAGYRPVTAAATELVEAANAQAARRSHLGGRTSVADAHLAGGAHLSFSASHPFPAAAAFRVPAVAASSFQITPPVLNGAAAAAAAPTPTPPPQDVLDAASAATHSASQAALLDAVRWLLPLKGIISEAEVSAEAAKLTLEVSLYLGRSPTQAVVEGARTLPRH